MITCIHRYIHTQMHTYIRICTCICICITYIYIYIYIYDIKNSDLQFYAELQVDMNIWIYIYIPIWYLSWLSCPCDSMKDDPGWPAYFCCHWSKLPVQVVGDCRIVELTKVGGGFYLEERPKYNLSRNCPSEYFRFVYLELICESLTSDLI